MPVLEVNPADQYIVATGDTPLLEIRSALPAGLLPPFPPVELPGGLGAWLERGGFGQNFFLGSEVLGLRIHTSQGRTLYSGGRTVKNVQGFDLVRPFLGSFGQLGQATEATLRLRPARASVFLVGQGDLANTSARFAWLHQGQLYVYHFGHPKEVLAFEQAFAGQLAGSDLDYRPLFPNGMGVGAGPLQDRRFSWADGGAIPPMPKAFARLAASL